MGISLASIKRGFALLSLFAIGALSNAFGQFYVDVQNEIKGSLPTTNGGYYLANAIGSVYISGVSGTSLIGPQISGSVGTDITVGKFGIAGLSLTWNLSISSDGFVLVNYTSHIGWLTVTGKVKTTHDAKTLPGYSAPPANAPSSGGSSTSGGSGSGASFNFTAPNSTTPSNGDFAVYWYENNISQTGYVPEGNVSMGPTVFVEYME